MRNATYIRVHSQNETINVIGYQIIQEDILAEIREAKFHTVMADEVTSHNDEILSICVSGIYTNQTNKRRAVSRKVK